MNFRPATPPPFRPFSPRPRVLPSKPLRRGNTGGRRSLIHRRLQRNLQRHRKPRRLNHNMNRSTFESPCVSAGPYMALMKHTCPGTGRVNHWEQDAAVNSASKHSRRGRTDGRPPRTGRGRHHRPHRAEAGGGHHRGRGPSGAPMAHGRRPESGRPGVPAGAPGTGSPGTQLRRHAAAGRHRGPPQERRARTNAALHCAGRGLGRAGGAQRGGGRPQRGRARNRQARRE